MQKINPDLDSPGCLLSKTHVEKILAISRTCWNWISCGHFWDIYIVSVEVATGKSNLYKFSILLRSFQGVFWIEDIEGYNNLDSYFAFNYLVCVWECIEVEQKIQFCQVAKFRGYYGQVQQVQYIFSTYLRNLVGLNDHKQLKNLSYKVNSWCYALLLFFKCKNWRQISVLGKSTHICWSKYQNYKISKRANVSISILQASLYECLYLNGATDKPNWTFHYTYAWLRASVTDRYKRSPLPFLTDILNEY